MTLTETLTTHAYEMDQIDGQHWHSPKTPTITNDADLTGDAQRCARSAGMYLNGTRSKMMADAYIAGFVHAYREANAQNH